MDGFLYLLNVAGLLLKERDEELSAMRRLVMQSARPREPQPPAPPNGSDPAHAGAAKEEG